MITINNCPVCEEEDIILQYDNRRMQFTLYCSYCDKVYHLSKNVKIECPECESKDIRFDEDETSCGECGLVLSATSNYVAGFKIKLDWGLIL